MQETEFTLLNLASFLPLTHLTAQDIAVDALSSLSQHNQGIKG